MILADIEGSPHIAHYRDAHDRRTEPHQLAYLRIDIADLAFALSHLNSLLQEILHYIYSAFRSLCVVGCHALLLLAGTILRHLILALGCCHLSLCCLVGSKSLVALLTADYAVVIEVLHTVVSLLGNGCSCLCLLNQLEGTLNLLLAGTGISQILHRLCCGIGSLEHLLLRFHLWNFEDSEGIAHVNVVALLHSQFYDAARQLAGHSVF